MLLLTGPPGSGKTRHVLEQVRDGIRGGAATVRLLVPTATMAQHLRHEMARREGLFPAEVIQTLHHFLRGFPTAFQPVSRPMLRRLVRRAVERDTPPGLESVRKFPGFQRAVGDLFDELSVAGVPASRLRRALENSAARPEHSGPLTEVLARIEDGLLERRLLSRGDYLRAVGRRISDDGPGGVRHILIDGFFTFTQAELELIRALAEESEDVTVTLPDWGGCERAREQLLGAGFTEKRLTGSRRHPAYEFVQAANLETEVAAVGRRIVTEVERGREFRDIGVVVRAEQPYGPAIEGALARFSVPARSYFGFSPRGHPAVRRIVLTVEACLAEWEAADVQRIVQLLPPSADRDRLDFRLREQLPGRGLELPRAADEQQCYTWLWDLFDWMQHSSEGEKTAGAWASLLCELAGKFPPPAVRDRVSPQQIALWRMHGAALDGFRRAIEETGTLFDPLEQITLAEFWDECRNVVEDARLFLRDQRRNVVHIMDAYEARQWELPLVFVCGLVEEEFPRRRASNPLLPDETRRELARRGIFLPSSAAAEREEQLLFELATTRATERVVLSYPVHDPAGNPNLPSFALAMLREKLGSTEQKTDAAAVPASRRQRALTPRPRILAEELQAKLAERWATLSPSRVEAFLACAFRFFAEHTLCLETVPAAPAERLDSRLQGTVIHETLAAPGPGPDETCDRFARIFEDAMKKERIPASYRTECIRQEMLRSLLAWMEADPLPPAERVLREEPFTLPLGDGLSVRGRIDRVDIGPGQKALVIDYKYATTTRIGQLVRETENDRRVQAGLYLAAARDVLGLEPGGMLYTALKRAPGWDGWHLSELGIGAGIGTRCTSDVIDERIERAVALTREVAERIRAGEIKPEPAEKRICDYCQQRDICRVAELEAQLASGGPQ